MIVGVPSETFDGERRVALVPASLPALTKAGHRVLVQAGAGQSAGFRDQQYAEKGGEIVSQRPLVFAADCLLQVRTLGANPQAAKADLPLLRKGQIVIGFSEPLVELASNRQMVEQGCLVFAMELIPRITRAQSMDALSSMASLAGYKAVLLAAEALPKIFPMLMTAAGTLTPAKVLVLGAGVAGLQAIATARRLGGVVTAYDLRPAVKEQVESLGAKFLELPLAVRQAEDQGGYAKEQDEAFYQQQRELLARALAESDVVITTAAIPGKKAPLLITAAMVAGMQPGSVIVDLAAERGGNCELTQPGESITAHAVSILGPLNLASTVPHHASQMYSRNVSALLLHLAPGGQLQLNPDDEITQQTLIK